MRCRVLTLALVLGAAAPAAAQDDPLLSGYGGPGAGDQAILGETFLPAGSPNGSLRARPGSGPAAPATGGAPTAGPGRGSLPAGTSGRPPAAAGTRPGGDAGGVPRADGSPAANDVPRGGSPRPSQAPVTPVTPALTATGGTAGAPVGRDEVVIALLVLAAVGAIALATNRLARTPLRA